MPVEQLEDVANAASDESEELYAGLRLLTVDDERTYVETYKKYFSKRGFEVFTANNVAEFEEHLKARHHHVILVDYYLDPDKTDGDRLMQLVEENDRDASVIVVTGRPSLDTAVVSLRQRAFDYLSKPIKVDELAKAVNRALDAKGLLRPSSNEVHRRIGEKIRTERKKQSLTLTQLAQRTGLSVGFLSQIELGKNSAAVETLYRIARALGIDVKDLL
jgi:DNA-binding NtrC family response regulator